MSHYSQLDKIYAEVSSAHDSITEFRGKLLGLVPALSGLAFTLIIGNADLDLRLLLPIGSTGAVVVIGLFCYEARGMLLCGALRDRGEALEQAMLDPGIKRPDDLGGHFLGRVERNKPAELVKLLDWRSPISVPTASFLVYGAVLLGWLTVIAFGIAGF